MADLLVDGSGSVFGEVAFGGDIAAKEHAPLAAAQGNGPKAITHAEAGDHLTGDTGHLLEIVGGTGGDFVFAVDDLFGDTAS